MENSSQPNKTNPATCIYYQESRIQSYVPSCCVEDGEIDNDVHPEDLEYWTNCPFCGGHIELKEGKKHPHLY